MGTKETFILVDKQLVQERIYSVQFACDLEKCKGACCTLESEWGAPLLSEELQSITEILEKVKPYIPEKSWNIISELGFYEEKESEFFTRSVENKDCVFVYYEGDVAKCAIERAYFDGKVDFRKPISCHLFPIRISDFGGDILRFEYFDTCAPALELGKKENIKLSDYLKDSLIRKYGEQWYDEFKLSAGV